MLTAMRRVRRSSRSSRSATRFRAATGSRRSRTGSRIGHARPGTRRRLRQPRDVDGAVPVRTAAPTAANGENDFDNSQVSRLILNQHSAGVLNGSFVDHEQRELPALLLELPRDREGGLRPRDPLHERGGIDYVIRQADAWPPPIGGAEPEQIGLVVALDVKSGKHKPIYGMGRHNHENSVADPGLRLPGRALGRRHVHVGRDGLRRRSRSSTRTSRRDTDALLERQGRSLGVRRRHAGVDDYYDFGRLDEVVTGHFVKVPKDIATGQARRHRDEGGDIGYPLPPTTAAGSATPHDDAAGLDGPQWVLEHWGDINNVFQFVRVEDIAYDKRPGMANVVYVVDSGRGRDAGSRPGRTLDERPGLEDGARPERPDEGDARSRSSIEGDDNARSRPTNEIHQPDNIETTATEPAHHGGPGLEPAVPGRLDRPDGHDRAALAVRPRAAGP